MTASVEQDGLPPCCDGRVFRLGPDWALCSFLLPTSMPIPLGVIEPAGMVLETWAFTGMTARASRPTCLLLVRAPVAEARIALERGTRFVVATHFHVVAVTTGPAEPAENLPPGDRAVMARAVLSAMTPRNAAALADPITLLAQALRAIPVPKDGPEVTVAADRSLACAVSGTDVPNYVLFDSNAGFRCARVATARLAFSPTPRMDLDLEPLWGPETWPPDRTFLVADGCFTAARLRAITA